MDIKSILQLVEAAQKTDFDVFEVEEQEFKIRLERKGEQIVVAAPAPAAAPMMAAPAAVAAPVAAAEPVAEAEASGPNIPNAKDIPSPLVGVFHELPGGKAVKIGDKVKKGDVICMIEAMKLMNEINMPEDGEIVWVAVEEGDTVEYDQLLFSYVK